MHLFFAPNWTLIPSSSPLLFFPGTKLTYTAYIWEGDALCFSLPAATTSTTFNDTLLGNSLSRTTFNRTGNSEHPKSIKTATTPPLWSYLGAGATLFLKGSWRQPVKRARHGLSALKLFGMSLSRQPLLSTPRILGFLICDMVQALFHRQEHQGCQRQGWQCLEYQQVVLRSPRSI